MRIAAIYDIHANLPALEAVIGKIRQEEVDGVVVGGDVLPGPMPLETLERLQDLHVPVRFIYGNGEVAVLEQLAGRDPAAVPGPYRPIIRWTAEQLDPEHQRFLAAWPKTLCLKLPGLGEVLFCHATPRDENECFTRLTPETRLLPVFAGLGAALVVCGHTHMQFDRKVGTTRVVNAGSVGMPFGQPLAIGSCWGRRLSFGTRRTICRKRPSAYAPPVTRKPRILLETASSTPHGAGHARGVLPRGAEVERVADCGRFDRSMMPPGRACGLSENGFAISSPESFLNRTGITACSQKTFGSLTCLFLAC